MYIFKAGELRTRRTLLLQTPPIYPNSRFFTPLNTPSALHISRTKLRASPTNTDAPLEGANQELDQHPRRQRRTSTTDTRGAPPRQARRGASYAARCATAHAWASAAAQFARYLAGESARFLRGAGTCCAEVPARPGLASFPSPKLLVCRRCPLRRGFPAA